MPGCEAGQEHDSRAFRQGGEPPFGVYVHIPFCRRRCDYCAFATWTDRDHLWERYVAACSAEVAGLASSVSAGEDTVGPARARGPATSVFFGGGTPSLLPAEFLARLIDAIREGVGIADGAEVTVECNPETISLEKLMQYKASGVTRLSFGAQSMVPHVLASLGRQHDPASVERAVELAGESGFAGAYNLDLIFGAAGRRWRTGRRPSTPSSPWNRDRLTSALTPSRWKQARRWPPSRPVTPLTTTKQRSTC